MYRVKVLIVKEVVEIEIEAKYCVVDANNNLVFYDRVAGAGEAVARVCTRSWISVRRVDGG